MNLSDAKLKDEEAIAKAKQRKLITEPTNWVANALGIVGWVGIIISLFIGRAILTDGFEKTGAWVALIGVVSSLFIVGFAEIIRLLHKIYLNTKK